MQPFDQSNEIHVYQLPSDLSSRYEASHFENIEKIESSHFWFSARREKICAAFNKFIPKGASVLEVGGGTGYVARRLQELGYDITVGDMHLEGLLYAQKKGVRKLCQFDLLNPPFQKQFDVVCLFDVLEHIQDDALALEAIQTMLKSRGKVVMTVPAHKWLWSRDDVIAGHYRRYEHKKLSQLLIKSGFRIVTMQYFFKSILPLLFIRRWMRRDSKKGLSQGEKIDFSLHRSMNWILSQLMRLEMSFDWALPNIAGGSLFVIAELKD
ncbi:MAG: hypothetical protein COT85_04005 [Chlamydiae bacterium CG10_big_fil_rev_8_21_14_0_10_42_34]|nr:MAG: hypothetical protein COT85_04005 [Chlamydiae bacterium CG10_big_fil_rev_8_21_14_0_10_42_34]